MAFKSFRYLLIIPLGTLLISVFLLLVSSEYNLAQVESMLYYINRDDIHYDETSFDKWQHSFGGAFAMSQDGSHIITLLPRTQDRPENYALLSPSPDGSRVLVDSNFDLYVIELNTRRPIRLTDYENPRNSIQLDASHAYWSPTGEWIAYEVEDINGGMTALDIGIWIVKADGTKHYQVIRADETTGLTSLWGWSEDGKLKVWYTHDGQNGIFLVSMDGKHSEWYSEWNTGTFWSPDNRFFITTQPFEGKVSLFSHDSPDQGIDILPPGLNPDDITIQDPEWSPNGRWFVLPIDLRIPVDEDKKYFETRRLGYLFSADGKTRIDLNEEFGLSEFEELSIISLGWSSDSSLLALRAKMGYPPYNPPDLIDWLLEGIYTYSPELHLFRAVPMPTTSDLTGIGWWPQPKKGPLGIPIQIVRYGVLYRNLLVIIIGLNVFLLSIIVISLLRGHFHAKENLGQ